MDDGGLGSKIVVLHLVDIVYYVVNPTYSQRESLVSVSGMANAADRGRPQKNRGVRLPMAIEVDAFASFKRSSVLEWLE